MKINSVITAKGKIEEDPWERPAELAGYVEARGEHLYTVLHNAAQPKACVLMAGPFASERQYSYVPWVRWARFLAERGIVALRFDYRGVGESTGVFADSTFGEWSDDVDLLARWLQSRYPQVPLILHGLELGALFVRNTFARGVGTAALLWSMPRNANEVLRASLLHQVAVNQTFKSGYAPTTVSEYIRELEEKRVIEVEGYTWSERLWRESVQVGVPSYYDSCANHAGERPLRIVNLDRTAKPLVGTSQLRFVSIINPDLSSLFAENFNWIASMLDNQRNRHGNKD